ncbi:MAG: TolC family protein [Bacteroidota bacterium]
MNRFGILGLILLLCLSVQAQDNDAIYSLQECLEIAKERNLAYQQVALRQQSSEVDLQQAQAARYPNLNVSPNWSSTFGRAIDPTSNEFANERFDAFNVNLTSNITVYNGFRLQNTLKQRTLDLKAAKKDLEQQEYTLSLNVITAYLNILFQGEILESARLQVASTTEQRDRIRKLVQSGSLAQADLAQIESQIATEELQVVNAQNALELAYLTLQQLMSLDVSASFGIVRPDLPDPEMSYVLTPSDEIYAMATNNYPDLDAAQLRLSSAQVGVDIAKSNYYPTLTFGVNAFSAWSGIREQPVGTEEISESVSVEFLGDRETLTFFRNAPVFGAYPFFSQITDNVNLGLGVRLDIPIYNRNFAKASVDRANILVQQSQVSVQLAEQQLQQAVEQAYLDARNAYSSYSAILKQVDALDLTFQNVERQFELGASNSVDFLVAKNNLNRAKFDRVRSKFDYIFRVKILDFYQGKPIDF